MTVDISEDEYVDVSSEDGELLIDGEILDGRDVNLDISRVGNDSNRVVDDEGDDESDDESEYNLLEELEQSGISNTDLEDVDRPVFLEDTEEEFYINGNVVGKFIEMEQTGEVVYSYLIEDKYRDEIDGYEGYHIAVKALGEALKRGIRRIYLHAWSEDEKDVTYEFYLDEYIREGVDMDYKGEEKKLLDVSASKNKINNYSYRDAKVEK